MARNTNLVAKGKRVALHALLQQGQLSNDLAIKYAKEVALRGFSATLQQTLSSKLALLGTLSAARRDKAGISKANRAAERKALAEVKTFKRLLDVALEDLYARALFEDGFSVPVAAEAFSTGRRKLGRSTPKVLEYLGRIRPQVEKLKDLLAPYFGGEDAVAQLDTVFSALQEADAVQEINRKLLPQDTNDVYQLKGEVLFLIERLNRAGRAAFDGDAGKASQFNKDLLRRARRRGTESVEDGERA